MRAANKREAVKVDENGRRRNAAQRARRLAHNQADAMPVVAPGDGPRQVRVVEGDLRDPAPTGGLREVLSQRYLLRLIVQRQLAQMYAASALGLLWSYIQPAIRFGTYYLVFAVLLQAHRTTPAFAVHLFTGMVFVHLFTEAWSGGTRSITQNRALVLKMRMPREVFPVASMLVALYHTFPQVLVLVLCCVLSGWHVTLGSVAAAVLGLAIVMSFGMAAGLFFSALNVFYRDFQNIVATIMSFLHFMVPMMYGFDRVWKLHDSHPWIYQLYMANPLTEGVLLLQKFFWYPVLDAEQHRGNTIIAGGRRVIAFPPDVWERGLISLVVCLLLLWAAQRFFSRVEDKFPERL